MNILIFMDGVLRGGFGQPLRTGTHFLAPMFEEHRVMLVGNRYEDDKRWLEEENITAYTSLTEIDPLDEEAGTAWRTLSIARSRGQIELVITADPERAAECFTLGYETMLYVSPAFARPVWRPDNRKTDGPTPWSAFMEEVRAQRLAAAAIPPVADE